jgi:hypothetical protein
MALTREPSVRSVLAFTHKTAESLQIHRADAADKPLARAIESSRLLFTATLAACVLTASAGTP